MVRTEWTEVKDLDTQDLFEWRGEIVVTRDAENDPIKAEEEPLAPEERAEVLERFTTYSL